MFDILELVKNELINFFSLHELIKLINSGDYSSLRTWSGITGALSPLIPFIIRI
jgi:hypothetical protein